METREDVLRLNTTVGLTDADPAKLISRITHVGTHDKAYEILEREDAEEELEVAPGE